MEKDGRDSGLSGVSGSGEQASESPELNKLVADDLQGLSLNEDEIMDSREVTADYPPAGPSETEDASEGEDSVEVNIQRISDSDDDSHDPDDAKRNLLNIYRLFKESIFADHADKQHTGPGSCIPTIEEFWKSYLLNFVDSCGWIAYWISFDYEAQQWPIKRSIKGLLQIVDFDQDKLTVKAILLRREDEEESQNGIVNPDHWPLRETIDDIPICDVEPLRVVQGFLSNIHTFNEALNNYRDYKLLWSVPWFKGVPAPNWFEHCCIKGLDIQYDLENPGAYSSQQREEVMTLLRRIRKFEREIEDLENKIPDDFDFEESVEGEDEYEIYRGRLPYLYMQLDKMGCKLNYITDPILRSVFEMSQKEQKAKELEGLELLHLVVVLSDSEPINFLLISEIHNIADLWLKKMNPDVEINCVLTPFKILHSLDDAVKNCRAGALIVVGPGTFPLTGLGNLCTGGAIIGVCKDDESVNVVTSGGTGDIWLVVGEGSENCNVEICNINLLINDGFSEEVMSHGVVVLNQSSLILQNVSFINVGGDDSDDIELDTTSSTLKEMDLLRSGPEKQIIAVEVKENALFEQINCRFTGFVKNVVFEASEENDNGDS